MNVDCAKCVAAAFAIFCTTACAESAIPDQQPYPLPADVLQSVEKLASDCDILVLGEMHGTKEVPAVAETLLDPLTKLGYRAIALELPRDEQRVIDNWATGLTDVVPKFFEHPGEDGRGNEQVLALVRRALRPPFDWKLICFDGTDVEMKQQFMERLPKDAKGSTAELVAKLTPDDIVALSVQRDAAMAKSLSDEHKKWQTRDKVLAICGNVHARTANHAATDSPLAALWPSFAAVLKRDNPQWRVLSINVRLFSGEFFNGGKVNKLGKRPLERVEMRLTPDADWDAELNLPQATAATFLATPISVYAPAESASETPPTK